MLQHSALKYNLDFNSSLNYSASGVYTSNWFDTQSQGLTVLFDEYTSTQVVPADSSISHEFRTSNTMSTGAVWTTSLAAASGRYVQFRSTLGKKEAGSSPALQAITLTPNAKGQENTANLTTFPFEFDNAAWNKTRTSIVSNAAIAPDGTLTADKLVEDATATNSHYTRQSVLPSDAICTISCYMKAGERVWGILAFESNSSTYVAHYNLTNGTMGVVGSNILSTSVQDVGNGWYRCSATALTTSSIRQISIHPSHSSNGRVYTGDGNSGIYIWGAQAEARSFMSDFTEGTRLAKTIMIEEGSTNLLTYSEDFNNAAWTNVAATISSGFVAPNGGTVAYKLIASSGVEAQHMTKQSFSATANITYTFSTYLKAGEHKYAAMTFSNYSNWVGGAPFVYFDLVNGTATTTGTGSAYSIKHVGNGWYRLSITVVNGASAHASAANILIAESGSDSSFVGDNVSGIYIWGTQLESKAYPTSYIPTTSASATRNSETLQIPAGSFNPASGAVIMRVFVPDSYAGIAPVGTSRYLFDSRLLNNNNGIVCSLQTDNRYYFGQVDDQGNSSASANFLNNLTAGWHTFGFTWQLNKSTIWVDGVVRATQTASVNKMPTVANAVNIGTLKNGNNVWNERFDNFQIFREIPSDSEMVAWTT